MNTRVHVQTHVTQTLYLTQTVDGERQKWRDKKTGGKTVETYK